MKRRVFLRWAGAALLAGFVGIRTPELEEEKSTQLVEGLELGQEYWVRTREDSRDAFYAYGSQYAELVLKRPYGSIKRLTL